MKQAKTAPTTASAEPVEDASTDPVPAAKPQPAGLALELSQQLLGKLRHSAQEEGVSVEQLASELLAEGVVLRAWEIIERKSAMRGSQGGHPQGPQGNTQRRGPGQYGNNANNARGPQQGGGGNRRPNTNWMEDKAAFLEYVRNQEKRGR